MHQEDSQTNRRPSRALLIVVAAGILALVGGGIALSLGGPSVEDLAARATPEQQAAFADGVVTVEEFHQAVARTAECLEQGGATVEDIKVSDTRAYYSFTFSVDAGAGISDEALLNECRSRFLDQIAAGFGLTVRDADPEARNAELVACLREAGIDVPADAAAKEIVETVDQTPGLDAKIAFDACVDRINGVEP